MVKQASSTSFHTAMRRLGFERSPGGVYRDSPEVRQICSAGISRANMLASVTLGLWIFRLSDAVPNVCFQCHIYGSLGSICPVFRNLRVITGATDFAAWRELIECADEIAKEIDTLLTAESLIRAYAEGRFAACLVRKEARAFLRQESEAG